MYSYIHNLLALLLALTSATIVTQSSTILIKFDNENQQNNRRLFIIDKALNLIAVCNSCKVYQRKNAPQMNTDK